MSELAGSPEVCHSVPNNPLKSTQRIVRKPKCSRCGNHGVISPLKGHKRSCRWKDCQCPQCSRVLESQKEMAAKITIKRHMNSNNPNSKEKVSRAQTLLENQKKKRKMEKSQQLSQQGSRQFNTQWSEQFLSQWLTQSRISKAESNPYQVMNLLSVRSRRRKCFADKELDSCEILPEQNISLQSVPTPWWTPTNSSVASTGSFGSYGLFQSLKPSTIVRSVEQPLIIRPKFQVQGDECNISEEILNFSHTMASTNPSLSFYASSCDPSTVIKPEKLDSTLGLGEEITPVQPLSSFYAIPSDSSLAFKSERDMNFNPEITPAMRSLSFYASPCDRSSAFNQDLPEDVMSFKRDTSVLMPTFNFYGSTRDPSLSAFKRVSAGSSISTGVDDNKLSINQLDKKEEAVTKNSLSFSVESIIGKK